MLVMMTLLITTIVGPLLSALYACSYSYRDFDRAFSKV